MGSFPISDRAEQSVLCLTRVKARVLYHDRHVRLDDAGKISSRRNFFRLAQIIKPDVLCAARRHCNCIGAGRFPIRKEDGNKDVSILIRGVEQADGLVTGEFRFGAVTQLGI
jgi:hypothetical protein